MSKINAVRLININYNNNAIRINDETLNFNGESTLISLQNGGGKSVLVQMIMAPFVHKKYRNVKDRPFDNYFTTAKPSFILVEWSLDGSDSKMMNGFMIRRSQEESEDQQEQLDIIGIVSEYQEPCMWDIHNLPVVEKTKKEMLLKGYTACRQLFEGYKKDRDSIFCCYDMSSPGQQRQYFEKLREYHVDCKEWETIIKKVNEKEGGLADLFADCKDERGLLVKWFLPSVEAKLDKEGGRIHGFEQNIEKHIKQYYESEDKIKRRDNIRKFKEEVVSSPVNIPTVRLFAENYIEKEAEKSRQESRIALFRDKVESLRDETDGQIEALIQELQDVRQRILGIRYEKYSYELMKLEEEQEEHKAHLSKLSNQIKAIEGEAQQVEEQMGILSCRKYYEQYRQEKREYDDIFEQLKAERAKDEDTRPRREELGGILYACYTEQLQTIARRLSECKETIAEKNEDIKKSERLILEAGEEARRKSAELGRLSALIGTYDERENEYNLKYQGELARNILGTYEEGTLSVEKEHLRLKQLKKEKELRVKREKKVSVENALDRNSHELASARSCQMEESYKKESAGKELAELEQEVEQRKTILQYIELGEESLFDTDRILRKIEGKIAEVEGILSGLKEQERMLKKEYDAMAEGRIYELSESFRGALKLLGIEEPYGLRWLRTNGKSLDENLELVRRNPFLPYALILTQGEYKRLRDMDETLYSEIPIPIIIRNDLEHGEYKTVGGTVELDKLKFYVRFHENLLDGEKLMELLKQKEEELYHIAEKIRIRENEKAEHNNRLSIIRNQHLTQDVYDGTKRRMELFDAEIRRYTEQIAEHEMKTARLEEEWECLTREIGLDELKQKLLMERSEYLEVLIRAYEEYIILRKSEKSVKVELERLAERQELLRDEQEKQRESLSELERRNNEIMREEEEVEGKLQNYRQYEENAKIIVINDMDQKRMGKYEAEYRAISEKLDRDIRRLEEELKKQEERLQNVNEDFNTQRKDCQKETGLEEEELKRRIEDVRYRREDEERFKERQKELKRLSKQKEERQNEVRIQLAVRDNIIKGKLAEMKKETGKESPLEREKIIPREYDSEIALMQYQQEERETFKEDLESKKQGLNTVLSGLAEYEGFQAEEGDSLKLELTLMDKQELERQKGILVRDYNGIKEEIHIARNRLDGRVRDVLAIHEFQEDYYRKPLEAMLGLVDQPSELLRQIEITVQAYDDLMKKIEVDLSLIEKERTNIIGELMEYVKAVHTDLNKIDSNSTIPVRDRTLKMLDIKLPVWQDQEELYQVRIRDFMEQLTAHGIELYKQNENAQEYFGTQINTRVLYDTVVGLANVQIKLYKIEKQREYPITWAEVAKNSGGEGFLSTFVILSCLLHYMRRDDTDIFAERNESKVLVMDNPFGLTYSEHLLRPLMEMAKKNNTQLICLSGLGGDSIYGRFDNIYILNLVTASLKNGTQFLRTEHYRGTDPETIIASQFEVVEQLTLF